MLNFLHEKACFFSRKVFKSSQKMIYREERKRAWDFFSPRSNEGVNGLMRSLRCNFHPLFHTRIFYRPTRSLIFMPSHPVASGKSSFSLEIQTQKSKLHARHENFLKWALNIFVALKIGFFPSICGLVYTSKTIKSSTKLQESFRH